jgi:hypothetical protein
MNNEEVNNNSITLNTQFNEECFKVTIEQKLKNAVHERLTTDINYIKNLFHELIPHNLTAEEHAQLLLYILNAYSENVDLTALSSELKGYLNSLYLKLLENANYKNIYQNTQLIRLFNDILEKYFNPDNELKIQMIYDSFIKFKKSLNTINTLSFFQVFTINQLYKVQRYDKIIELVEYFNIDEFDSIIDRELIRDSLFSYFHKIAYSLMVSKHYRRAYQILTTTMSLNLESVDLQDFQNMLAELVFVSLMLNINKSNINFVLIKHRRWIRSEILNTFQSFQSYNFEYFVCNYYLYILQLQNNKNTELSRLYNKESLIYLVNQLLQNKFQILSKKLSPLLIKKRQDEINTKISNINVVFQSYDLQLPSFVFKDTFETTSDNLSTLFKDAHRLSDLNAYTKQISPRFE